MSFIESKNDFPVNETRVYQITASYNLLVYKKLFMLTNNNEKNYLQKYRIFKDRYNSLLGLSLAKKLSGASLHEELSLLHTKMGQPYLTGCKEHISISHCEDTIIAAISSCKVGVDIEKKLPKKGYELFLANEEYDLFDKSRNKVDLLTTLWTLKESYSKLKGAGFFLDPASISFHLIEDKWFLRGSECSFYSVNLLNGMRLSLAMEEKKSIRLKEITEGVLVEYLYNNI